MQQEHKQQQQHKNSVLTQMSSSYFNELDCSHGIPKKTFELRRKKLLAPFFTCSEIYGSLSPCTMFRKIESSKYYKPPPWLRCSPKREISVWARAVRGCPARLRERGVRVRADDLCAGLAAAADACLSPVRKCYDFRTAEGREAAKMFGLEVAAAGLAWMGESKGPLSMTCENSHEFGLFSTLFENDTLFIPEPPDFTYLQEETRYHHRAYGHRIKVEFELLDQMLEQIDQEADNDINLED